MIPQNAKRVEYHVGQDAYDRTVTAKFERTYDGKQVWTIHRDEGGQRDNPESVSGLTTENLRRLGEIVA